MKRHSIIFLLFSLLIWSPVLQAQESTPSPNLSELDGIIHTLYEVISGEKGEARDWELFRSLFHEDARLIPSGPRENGIFAVRYMSPNDYVSISGKWLVENGFFEKEIHRKVDHFGNIYQVFSTYEAFRSKSDVKPFMRGINSIQLVFDGKRFYILNIFWQQESESSPIPEKYLPKN